MFFCFHHTYNNLNASFKTKNADATTVMTRMARIRIENEITIKFIWDKMLKMPTQLGACVWFSSPSFDDNKLSPTCGWSSSFFWCLLSFHLQHHNYDRNAFVFVGFVWNATNQHHNKYSWFIQLFCSRSILGFTINNMIFIR